MLISFYLGWKSLIAPQIQDLDVMDKIKEASMEVSVYILSAEEIKKLNSIFAVMIMIRRAMLLW